MPTVLKSQSSAPALCCYKNQTQRIQVGKIADVQRQNLEKVIFPGETFLFKAHVEKKLAIYIELAGTITLLDGISCSDLQAQIV